MNWIVGLGSAFASSALFRSYLWYREINKHSGHKILFAPRMFELDEQEHTGYHEHQYIDPFDYPEEKH